MMFTIPKSFEKTTVDMNVATESRAHMTDMVRMVVFFFIAQMILHGGITYDDHHRNHGKKKKRDDHI